MPNLGLRHYQTRYPYPPLQWSAPPPVWPVGSTLHQTSHVWTHSAAIRARTETATGRDRLPTIISHAPQVEHAPSHRIASFGHRTSEVPRVTLNLSLIHISEP